MKEREVKKISKKYLAILVTLIMVMSLGVTAYAATKVTVSSNLYGAYEGSVSSSGKFTAWCSAAANADTNFTKSIYVSKWEGDASTRIVVNGITKKYDSQSTGDMTSNVMKIVYAGSMSGLSYAKAKANGASFYTYVSNSDTVKAYYNISYSEYIRGAWVTDSTTKVVEY